MAEDSDSKETPIAKVFDKDRKWKVIGVVIAVLTLIVGIIALRRRASTATAPTNPSVSGLNPFTSNLPTGGLSQNPTSDTTAMSSVSSSVPGSGNPSWIPSPGDLGFLRFASNTQEQQGSHINPHEGPNTETGGWTADYGEAINVLSAPVWSSAHNRYEVQIQGNDVATGVQRQGWVNEADLLSSLHLAPSQVNAVPPVGHN